MAFEIDLEPGAEPCLLAAAGASMLDDQEFFDFHGRSYTAYFDGCRVIFNDGERSFMGRWLPGSPATTIRRMRCLPDRFIFTFMDHGHAPQRLHALWEFAGSTAAAMDAWQQAGFSLSTFDGHLNPNHPASSIHLRTKGTAITGADSSHVVIFSDPGGDAATGEIHVGEFNPLTGFGIGFLLHQLEWLFGRRSSS